MLAFRNAGVVMSRFVQGRVITSLVSSKYGYPNCQPLSSPGLPQKPKKDSFGRPRPVLPLIPPDDPFGRPMPRPFVMETLHRLELLTAEEKLKFSHLFCDVLDLPKPPELPAEGKFAVKLVKFDPEKRMKLLSEVALVKFTVKVIKNIDDMGLEPTLDALQNVPSVIKEGITEEEANEIIAKIEAAGGVAVMEVME